MKISRPLTAAQMGIWLGQQLDADNPTYWTAEYIVLKGALDVEALQQAIAVTVRESDALHMRFHVIDDVPCQLPHDDAGGEYLAQMDFSDLPIGARETQAREWMQAHLQQPVNLEQDRLWHCAVLRLQPDEHWWMLQAHHIVLDGFGFALFMRRVAAAYGQLKNVATTPQRPLPSFHSVIDADQEYTESEQYQRDRAFWLTQLQHQPAPARLALPQPVARRVERCRALIDSATLQSWQRTARLQQVDWFCWIIGAVAVWLYDHTGRTAITLGIPVMNRLGSPALNVPCMHMNIVPFPLQLAPEKTFAQLLADIQQRWKQIRPHQRYRYEHLKQDLALQPGHRLFGPVINLMPFERPLQFADLNAHANPLSAGPVEDIAINIVPQTEGCLLSLEANPNCYSPTQLQFYLDDLQTHCQQMARIDQRPLSDRIAHRYTENLQQQDSLVVRADMTVCERLLLKTKQQPHATALLTPDGLRMGYGALLAAVQTLAGEIADRNIGEGDHVALLLPRGPDAIIALLAVLWAGAAYVPLDPVGPAQRRQRIIDHSAPALLITFSNLLPRDLSADLPVLLMDRQSRMVPTPLPLVSPRKVSVSTPAYLIYTSGSTGTPNGVVVNHGALSHFVAAASSRYGIHQNDRLLQFAPLHFDASVEEIFLALCNGAGLLLRNDAMLNNWQILLQQCERHQVTILDLPTSYWHEWVYAMTESALLPPACIKTVIIGGEAALPASLQCWQQRVDSSIRLINTYGPTECTVVCTSADLAGPHSTTTRESTITIGTPLPGIHCVILDEHLQPVLKGESGELCIFGPVLAQGYWQNEKLTQSRFITLPHWPGQPRVYRTGDKVLCSAQGQLIHLGRIDDEIKISGQRIAPAAIESVLSAHPSIRECAVLALPTSTITQLVAFIAAPTHIDIQLLRQWLQPQLLAAAIPQQFITLSRLPKNANNKIDRKALHLQWAQQQEALPAPTPATFTEQEMHVANAWHAVLGHMPQSPQDDFFVVGGKSLQAIQLANRLARLQGQPWPASQIFRYPVLADQANQLTMQDSATDDGVTAIEASGQALAPLIELQTGHGTPVFCLHPADGMSWCYLALSRHLPNIPLLGIQSPALSGAAPQTYSAMINHYLALIRTQQPQGPYRLLGWSSGGAIAHDLAARLQAQGDSVELLALLDAYPADHWRDAATPTRRDAMLMLLDDMAQAKDENGQPHTAEKLLAILRQPGGSLAAFDEPTLQILIDTALINMQLFRSAQHKCFQGDILFFRAGQRNPEQPDWQRWQPYVRGNIEIISLDCNHFAIHQRGTMHQISRIIAQRLALQSQTARDPA